MQQFVRSTRLYYSAGMLAADGRCKTLDASADGYVRAEAVGTILMRVLSNFEAKSLADENMPHAVILGSAVNQDGRSSSLTAPNGPAQQGLIRAALENAHLPPSKVGLGHDLSCKDSVDWHISSNCLGCISDISLST